MAGGFGLAEFAFIYGIGTSLSSSADAIAGIRVSNQATSLPPETAAAVAEIPGAVEAFVSATAKRVHGLAASARANAMEYEAVESSVEARFMGMIP